MSRSHTALICLLGVSLLAPVWRADAGVRTRSGMTVQPVGGQTQDTQASSVQPNSDPQLNDDKYGVIADRNVFKLKPLPLPGDSSKDNKPPEPPVKVTLTGITTILGDALAILEVQPPGGKPKIFLTLSEGERSGDVAVVTINQKASTVTIKNQDFTQTLDMGDAAKRAGAATGTATVGGSSGLPMIPPAGGDSRPRSIPTRRDMRVTSSGDNNSSNPNSNPNGGNGSSGLTMSGNGSPQPAASQGETMSPEEQVIAIEVNRELTKAQVQQGKLPPPPPTVITPSGSAGVDVPLP